MNINLVYMRNFIFSIVVLLSLTAFAPVAEAQEKVLTLSEAEALLEKAQQKYDQAKKDYRKSLKSPQEGTSLKAMRAASREVGRYRLEIFKAHKRDYLRERAELSDKEAAEFFPIYEELQTKMFRVQDDASRAIKRLMRSKEPVSETEYRAAVEKKIEAEMQEALLQKEYFEKFLQILPAQKIVNIFDSEARFSQEMMRNHWPNNKDQAGLPHPSTPKEK